MSYIENNLMAGENVLHRGYRHWIVFLWPVIWLFAAVFFLIVSFEAQSFSGVVLFISAVFMLSSIVAYIDAYINYKTSEFGITNKRVVVKVGFIRRQSAEILLNKVEGIQVDQGVLGRILGFGSIKVSGTGGLKNSFHNISEPIEFRKKAQEQIATVQGV